MAFELLLAALQLNYPHAQVSCYATSQIRKNSLASDRFVRDEDVPPPPQCPHRHVQLRIRAWALHLRRGEAVPHSFKWIFWPYTSKSIVHGGFSKATLLWNFVCFMHTHVTSLPVWGCSCVASAFLMLISVDASCLLLCLHCICIVLPFSCLSTYSAASFYKISDIPVLSQLYIYLFPIHRMLEGSFLSFIMSV